MPTMPTEEEPSGHRVHELEPVEFAKVPSMQSWQLACPTCLVADPKGHLEHDVAPGVEKRPALQSSHAVAADAEAKRPLLQGWQATAPSAAEN